MSRLNTPLNIRVDAVSYRNSKRASGVDVTLRYTYLPMISPYLFSVPIVVAREGFMKNCGKEESIT